MAPELPLLPLFDAALRGVLLAMLLLLAAALGRDRPRLPAARAGMLLLLGLALQVVGSAPPFEAAVPRLLQAPFVAVAAGNAVLFWVFVQAVCDDEFRLRRSHLVAWIAVALLAALNCLWIAGSGSAVAPLTLALQRAVPAVFAVLAALAAQARWRADLVEARRRLRAGIVAGGIGCSLLMLALRLAAPQGRLGGAAATLEMLLLLALVAPTSWALLRLGATDLFPERPARAVAAAAPAAAPPDAADAQLAAALQRLMAEQRAYRGEDLTVAGLAALLAVPEYRLRRVINQRLGHRNFTAFVNGWRLSDAQAALADPARQAQSVLSIALDAGFQSIGPFNRAFKAATGMTPTEFRRARLAET